MYLSSIQRQHNLDLETSTQPPGGLARAQTGTNTLPSYDPAQHTESSIPNESEEPSVGAVPGRHLEAIEAAACRHRLAESLEEQASQAEASAIDLGESVLAMRDQPELVLSMRSIQVDLYRQMAVAMQGAAAAWLASGELELAANAKLKEADAYAKQARLMGDRVWIVDPFGQTPAPRGEVPNAQSAAAYGAAAEILVKAGKHVKAAKALTQQGLACRRTGAHTAMVEAWGKAATLWEAAAMDVSSCGLDVAYAWERAAWHFMVCGRHREAAKASKSAAQAREATGQVAACQENQRKQARALDAVAQNDVAKHPVAAAKTWWSAAELWAAVDNHAEAERAIASSEAVFDIELEEEMSCD